MRLEAGGIVYRRSSGHYLCLSDSIFYFYFLLPHACIMPYVHIFFQKNTDDSLTDLRRKIDYYIFKITKDITDILPSRAIMDRYVTMLAVSRIKVPYGLCSSKETDQSVSPDSLTVFFIVYITNYIDSADPHIQTYLY